MNRETKGALEHEKKKKRKKEKGKKREKKEETGKQGLILTRKAQDPMKVAHVSAVAQASLLEAKPSAPQRVKPSAPMKFQKPMCHPSTLRAGTYHLRWVSSMKSRPETMKPEPPTTCGGDCQWNV